MKSYNLGDEFIDTELERGIIAAVAREPALYWELLDTLPAGAFAAEPQTWEAVAQAIEAETAPTIPDEWKPAGDAQAGVTMLACTGHDHTSLPMPCPDLAHPETP